MIQDTSFIIDLLRGDENAERLLDIIEKEARPQKVSAVTVLELYEGVARSQTPEPKQKRILKILDTKHVVSADHAVMRRAGKLSGELINDGKRIEREGLYYCRNRPPKRRTSCYEKHQTFRTRRWSRNSDLLAPPIVGYYRFSRW